MKTKTVKMGFLKVTLVATLASFALISGAFADESGTDNDGADLNTYVTVQAQLSDNHVAQRTTDRKIFSARAKLRKLSKQKGDKAALQAASVKQELESLYQTKQKLSTEQTALDERLVTITESCPTCARDAAVAEVTRGDDKRAPASATNGK